MYVGVIHRGLVEDAADVSIPHVCGGDPRDSTTRGDANEYSPCMWG